MKKLSIIAALVFTIVFLTSCEKQEINPSESANAPQISQTFTAESQAKEVQQTRKQYQKKINDMVLTVDIEKGAVSAHY